MALQSLTMLEGSRISFLSVYKFLLFTATRMTSPSGMMLVTSPIVLFGNMDRFHLMGHHFHCKNCSAHMAFQETT